MSNFLIDEDTDLLAAEFVLGSLDSEERANAQSLLRRDHGFIAMVRIWERRFGELHLMVEPVEPDAKILQRIKAKIAEISPSGPAPDGKPPTEMTPSPAPAETTGLSADMPGPAHPLVGEETPKPADVPAGGALATAETDKPAELLEAVPSPSPPPPPLELLDHDQGPARRPEIAADVVRSRGRWRLLAVCMSVLVGGLVALLAIWRVAPDRLPARLRPAELLMSVGIQPLPKAVPVPKPAPPEPQFDE